MLNTVHLINIIRFGIVLGAVLHLTTLRSQDFAPFINTVWFNNHQLKSQSFELEKARLANDEAKAMYRPSLTFGTQYTLATGGRAIDFPIGDLLNPIHSRLNEISGTQEFPTLQNQSILFLPNNFYDARVRIQQPIYYPDLAVNRKLSEVRQQMKGLKIKAYKRLLVRDFMEAYFQWKQAEQAIEIYQQANQLLDEAARSTSSMIRNGVALPSALSRIEGEMATVEAQQIEAKANEENAWAYLKFIIGDQAYTRDKMAIELPELPEINLSETEREELQQVALGLQMNELAIDQEDNFFKPKLGLQLDLGSQDFDFGWQPYGLFGFNLELNLFDGKRHQLRRQQALADFQGREEERLQLEEQFTLQVDLSRRNLESVVAQAETYQPRILAAEKNYRDVMKKYAAGSANYLELLDARIQVTQSQITYVVTRYRAWSSWSEFVYASAQYPIE